MGVTSEIQRALQQAGTTPTEASEGVCNRKTLQKAVKGGNVGSHILDRFAASLDREWLLVSKDMARLIKRLREKE